MQHTKESYIKDHPRSHLAAALESNDWPGDTPISVIGGLDAPDNPRSNLAQALQEATMGEYVRGGHRQRGSEGWWFAVA